MDKIKWVIGALIAAVVLVVGGTWVYINVIRDDAPPPLSFEADDDDDGEGDGQEATPTTAGDDDAGPETILGEPGGIEGAWAVGGDSQVAYRVGEILFGQTTEGVGTTDDVTGEMVIEGTTITAARFVVDMATFESDDNRRDNQFRGRIMDVDTHPTATLVLVEPIDLGGVPDDQEIVNVTASVELTLRGTTQVVPIDIRARRNGATIEADGALTIVFADWGIPNPSTTGISTEDRGDLEFVLFFQPS